MRRVTLHVYGVKNFCQKRLAVGLIDSQSTPKSGMFSAFKAAFTCSKSPRIAFVPRCFGTQYAPQIFHMFSTAAFFFSPKLLKKIL